MYGKKNYEEEINTKKISKYSHNTEEAFKCNQKQVCLCPLFSNNILESNDMEATDKVSLVLKKMFAI